MDGAKCCHEPCSCPVDLGEDYCSPHCLRMAEEDAEKPLGRCGCKHTSCFSAA